MPKNKISYKDSVVSPSYLKLLALTKNVRELTKPTCSEIPVKYSIKSITLTLLTLTSLIIFLRIN